MKAAFVMAALLIGTAIAMAGFVCMGNGGCPARMPWEMRSGG